ncbi:MAG: hypothetical protein FVQ84_11265 [Planctomycetes bacterium]|nr:hypothetical protein [Planctomycetota bacterium]
MFNEINQGNAMGQMKYRYSIVLCITLSMVFASGCPSVPHREFKSYSDAFAETKTITEQLLLEYDLAKQAETKRRSAGMNSVKRSPPYPPVVNLTHIDEGKSIKDPVNARRDALKVVTGFNSVLISLAEGKKPEEVKSATDSFIENLNDFSKLISEDFTIPYAGQVGAIISTIVTKLEEAENRKQFIAALREAEPIIQSILDLFAKDAQDIYKIKARQTDRIWSDHQDKVATLIRQIKTVAKEHSMPAGEMAKKLQNIEKEVRQVYNRAGLYDNTEELLTTGNKPLDELTISQFQQTLVQANSETDKYESIIKAQIAFHELIISYGQLLNKTKSTLTTVRLALDAPVDIRQQANELISFVFAVKRDWEALNDARRSIRSN